MKVRHKKLYEITLRLTKRAVEFLEKIPKEQVPTREDTKVDYFNLLLNSKKEIMQFPEFADYAEYVIDNKVMRKTFHLSDKDGKPVNDLKPTHVYDFNFLRFMHRYLDQMDSFTFNQEIFDKTFCDLMNYFYKRTIEISYYSPLENFSCPTEVILQKNLKIRDISDSAKKEYKRYKELFNGAFSQTIDRNISHVLEISYNRKRGKAVDKLFYRQDFKDVITSLRLYKHGAVNFHVINYNTDIWQPNSMKSLDVDESRYKFPSGSRYILTTSEIDGFRDVFRKYIKFQERNRKNPIEYLNIAINRFNLGVEETEIEDKVIDFMISFEAIFLQSNAELTFRLANRVAILLGKTGDERRTIRETMKTAYEWRSSIVHSEKKKQLKIQQKNIPEQLIIKIEDILRKAILGFINLDGKTKKIVDELDNSLLDATAMKDLQKNADVP